MVNLAIVQGRLGSDAEIKENKEEPSKSLLRFSLATSRRYKKQVEGKEKLMERTEWHDITVFASTAGYQYLVETLKKGTLCFVRGRISTYEYKNKEGQEVKKKRIVASEVRVVSYGKATAPKEVGEKAVEPYRKAEQSQLEEDNQSLPF